MANIPKRVEDRLGVELKKFQPILSVSKFHNVRRSGLKTTYYLRSLGASSIEKASVASKKEVRGVAGAGATPAPTDEPAKKVYTEEEKRVCSIEAVKNGEICEACQ
jgi:ribonucleoside-diphosphate reductase alpha chain